MDTWNFECVKECQYLCANLTHDKNMSSEIRTRIRMAIMITAAVLTNCYWDVSNTKYWEEYIIDETTGPYQIRTNEELKSFFNHLNKYLSEQDIFIERFIKGIWEEKEREREKTAICPVKVQKLLLLAK